MTALKDSDANELGRASRSAGNIKVSREDWLKKAMEILISRGVEQVKILTLSDRLNVSRSSFYWYFKDRQELLDALLEIWEHSNTGVLRRQAALPARTITGAICNLFLSFVGSDGFDHRLDFAIREWARRSGKVQDLVRETDRTRVTLISELFERHEYSPEEALSRARILYYMQIGYYALELHEDLETRLANVPGYLEGFTGVAPATDELAEFMTAARATAQRRSS